MRPRAPCLHEMRFPVDLPEFAAIVEHWPEHVVEEMLSLVWEGFDQMKSKHFQGFDFSQPIEQLERGLTDLHADEILLLWKQRSDGFESFIPKPEAWEFRNRKNASAMPSSIDIGFVLIANRSIRWSVEGKVLEHAADVGRYLKDLDDKYLSGQASPFSGTAALAGYLRSALAKDVFPHLEKRLGQKLETHAPFANRPHRISRHERTASGTSEKTDFTCHHLILSLSS